MAKSEFFVPQIIGNYVLGRTPDEANKEVWISGMTVQTIEVSNQLVIAQTSDAAYTVAACRTDIDAQRECFHLIMALDQGQQDPAQGE